MSAARSIPETSRLPLLWICAATATALLLHAFQVPAWITITALGLVGWRLAALRGAVPLPGGIVRITLGLALVAAVFAQFHTLNGLVPGTAMLMLMAAIKLLETRSQRDQYVVIGGALFLLLAACLYAPGARVGAALRGAGVAVLRGARRRSLCARKRRAALPAAARPTDARGHHACGPLAAFRHTACDPAVSLLPAPAGPLLGADVGGPGHQRARRYADTRQHHESDDLLCHRLQGTLRRQPASTRRALLARSVLHEFDGTTWKAGRYTPDAQQLDCLSTPYRYHLYLEPTFRHWWLALDTVMGSPSPGVRYTDDYQLIADQPVSQSLSYDATSCAHVRTTEPLSSTARLNDTELPSRAKSPNPRLGPATAPPRRLRRRVRAGRARVPAHRRIHLLAHSAPSRRGPDRRLPIRHAHRLLRPLRLRIRRHDESRRRSGASGHRLSRWQWNPYDGMLTVRQSDAHAWAEVWLQTAAGPAWTPPPSSRPRGSTAASSTCCRSDSPPPSASCTPGPGSTPPSSAGMP